MGQSFSSPALGAYAPVIAVAGCLLATLRSAADSAGADGGLAATIAALASGSVEVSGALLLALALAVVLVAAQSMMPQRRKVFVLDFAVHTPHPR